MVKDKWSTSQSITIHQVEFVFRTPQWSRFRAIPWKACPLSSWILHYPLTMEENLNKKIRRSQHPTPDKGSFCVSHSRWHFTRIKVIVVCQTEYKCRALLGCVRRVRHVRPPSPMLRSFVCATAKRRRRAVNRGKCQRHLIAKNTSTFNEFYMISTIYEFVVGVQYGYLQKNLLIINKFDLIQYRWYTIL